MKDECMEFLSKVWRGSFAAKKKKKKIQYMQYKSMSDQNETVRVTLLMKRTCLHGVIDE